MVSQLKNKVLSGESISREEALELCGAPLDELCAAADEIRAHFCGNGFDICTIINAKSGKCSENCRYCAQSAHYGGSCEEYSLISAEKALEAAQESKRNGALRFSLVTSGKRLTEAEVDSVCGIIRRIRTECGISVCGSFGLLDAAAFKKLKDAGLERVHNNLETSRRFFPEVCTTHTFDDKLAAVRAARSAGLTVCSGGIMGLGEAPEDRIDMALELRALGVRSVPVNVLNPISGTPLENRTPLANDEVRRICAVFRFILPQAAIRLAGGRRLLGDDGRGCFKSGANAAISGNMLTTIGESVKSDVEMIKELGYKAEMAE
ncbi:MAG: biotin synthase BioB [bacterium]|nr:biotin synthase BioB [bacterium]